MTRILSAILTDHARPVSLFFFCETGQSVPSQSAPDVHGRGREAHKVLPAHPLLSYALTTPSPNCVAPTCSGHAMPVLSAKSKTNLHVCHKLYRYRVCMSSDLELSGRCQATTLGVQGSLPPQLPRSSTPPPSLRRHPPKHPFSCLNTSFSALFPPFLRLFFPLTVEREVAAGEPLVPGGDAEGVRKACAVGGGC
eukprot:1940520-Rhodomonas_salina.1